MTRCNVLFAIRLKKTRVARVSKDVEVKPLRILVVDDHAAVRRGICSLLSLRPEWRVCGEACDGVEAIEKARQLAPDFILMDISMPRMDGAAASKVIHHDAPATEVILVSQNDSSVIKQVAAETGASAYVPKSSLAHDLLPTIDHVLAQRKAQNN
jgi:two-component system secretion response regulator SsrB